MNHPASSDLEVTQIEDVVVVKFLRAGMLESDQIPAATEAINQLLGGSDATKFVIDFEAIDYLNSTGIGMLIALRQDALQRGQQIRLCSMSPDVRSVFSVLQLDQVFGIFDSQQSATENY